MASKRDHSETSYSHSEVVSQQIPAKKARNQAGSGRGKPQDAKIDQTYGQRCVFGDLDDYAAPEEDGLEFEDDSEALAYLRSVRTESNGIPTLLVAPKAGPQLPPEFDSGDGVDRSIYTNSVGDSRGYYQDGAYFAGPDSEAGENADEDWHEGRDGPSARHNHASEHSPADAFYQSLTSQFMELRDLLHRDPPIAAVEALPEGHETTVGRFGPNSYTFAKWEKHLRNTDPLPVQVAAMDRHSTLKLLRIILGGKFLRRGCELRERTSRWIWALLARLPDSGEMGYEEVGWIRDLGKRAVLMIVSLAHMAALQDEVSDLDGDNLGEGDSDMGEDEDEDQAVGITQERGAERKGKEAEEGSMLASRGQAEGEQMNGDGQTAIDINQNPGEVFQRFTNSSELETAAVSGSKNQDDQKDLDDSGEMAMDIDTEEEGEVSDEPTPRNRQVDLAAAKERLMQRLQNSGKGDLDDDAAEQHITDDEYLDELDEFDEFRSRMNMRATLNMILTVAGEFYGQRDLLEFRNPFTSL